MGNERAEELIRKYLEGTATPEEEALLESWYIAMAQNQPDMGGAPDYPKIEAEMLEALRAEQGDQPIPAQQQPELPRVGQPKIKAPMKLWPRVVAAACILVVLAVGSFFVFRKTPRPPVAQQRQLPNDILPASTTATLTLVDGQTISLDSAHGGPLARQGNASVSSLNGLLIYSVNQGQPLSTGSTYNTLITHAGEHYALVLADGTKVWLNAASSITYPVVFNGNERKVKVTGEVYFEIVHNAKQPFRIAARNELVEDIGTHLNIDAYDNESVINTTLLEGSIKLTRGSASAILKPGEQATIRPNGNSFQLQKVDADAAIAWKNGYFYFDRADIQTVMRELARWYNVQVIYKGEIPKKTFKGKVYRNIHASEALQILSYFGAHFQIDGKTITVTF